MIKGYLEIRKTSLLVDYYPKLAANATLWIEHYVDDTREYFALFTETSTSRFPNTITYNDLV